MQQRQQQPQRQQSRRDRLLTEPIDPKFVTEASDNFGFQIKQTPNEIPRAFKVLFDHGAFVPMTEKAAPEIRWRDVTQFLNDGKEKMQKIVLYQEFLEQKKHELTRQLLAALKVRKALVPIIDDIAPAATQVTKNSFANIINSMTDMAIPAKAKAMLHAAATIAINHLEAEDRDEAMPPANATPKQPYVDVTSKESPQSRSPTPQPRGTPGRKTPNGQLSPREREDDASANPAHDRPIDADYASFGAYVHNVYSSSFAEYADAENEWLGAEADPYGSDAMQSDSEEVPQAPLSAEVVPVPINSSSDDDGSTPWIKTVPLLEEPQGEDGKRRRLRNKTAAPPDTPGVGALRPPPAEGFTQRAGNAAGSATALRASAAARLASPAVKVGAARVKTPKPKGTKKQQGKKK